MFCDIGIKRFAEKKSLQLSTAKSDLIAFWEKGIKFTSSREETPTHSECIGTVYRPSIYYKIIDK